MDRAVPSRAQLSVTVGRKMNYISASEDRTSCSVSCVADNSLFRDVVYCVAEVRSDRHPNLLLMGRTVVR